VHPTLTLYSAPDCVICHRIRLILSAKGVVYDLVTVDPRWPPERFVRSNPECTLPTFAERDLVLDTPSVLSEYLNERYPHPPLLPIDPLARLRLRMAVWRIEHEWVPAVQAIQGGSKTQAEAARKRLAQLLTASIPLFKTGTFLLNPEISLADCALVPILWRLDALGVALPGGGGVIADYGKRIFRSQGFARSLTQHERELRALPE